MLIRKIFVRDGPMRLKRIENAVPFLKTLEKTQ